MIFQPQNQDRSKEKKQPKKWLLATLRETGMAAENIRSLVFDVPGFGPHRPGQHVDVRLTAEGGYVAERAYSLANAPLMGGAGNREGKEDTVELGVQILPDGEVSPYLWDMAPGGTVEVRGPLGGHFVWDTTMPGPLVMMAGGSGTVPMMSMLREHMRVRREEKTERKAAEADRPVILAISARRRALLPYWEEIQGICEEAGNVNVTATLSDVVADEMADEMEREWRGMRGRFGREHIREILAPVMGLMPMVYICGPTPFVEAMARYTVEAGINPHEVRTERFGG